MDAPAPTRANHLEGGGFRPTRVLAVDLDDPLPAIDAGVGRTGVPYGDAQVLVRLHGAPLGTVQVDVGDGPAPPERLARLISTELGDAVAAHLAEDDRTGGVGSCMRATELGVDPPLVSVVVATFHRPDLLTGCVDSLLANDHPRFEVVVADNSPDDIRTRDVLAERYGHDARVRYLAEPAPGTSNARNAGLAAARGELVAFTDDDVVVDPGWIRALAVTLMFDDGVACATGLTQPYELETAPQVWFEQYGGMNGGYQARALDRTMPEPPSRLFPYTPAVGASNNMVIRRQVVDDLEGFDVRLGPGTPTLGGEDLDLFVRLLVGGHRVRVPAPGTGLAPPPGGPRGAAPARVRLRGRLGRRADQVVPARTGAAGPDPPQRPTPPGGVRTPLARPGRHRDHHVATSQPGPGPAARRGGGSRAMACVRRPAAPGRAEPTSAVGQVRAGRVDTVRAGNGPVRAGNRRRRRSQGGAGGQVAGHDRPGTDPAVVTDVDLADHHHVGSHEDPLPQGRRSVTGLADGRALVQGALGAHRGEVGTPPDPGRGGGVGRGRSRNRGAGRCP